MYFFGLFCFRALKILPETISPTIGSLTTGPIERPIFLPFVLCLICRFPIIINLILFLKDINSVNGEIKLNVITEE